MNRKLFHYLEFSGLDDIAVPVEKLEDVYASVKFIEVDVHTAGGILYFIHFFAHEIEYEQGISGVKALLVVKVDER